MSKVDHEQIHAFRELQMADHLGKWYSWDSPIGLSIFFLTLTFIGIAIFYVVTGFGR